MYAPKSPYIAMIAGLMLLSGAALVYSRIMQGMPRGDWGGAHISLNVGDRSATVEYDCAHGEIHGPLTVDGEGKFKLRGTFTAERGGPIRAGETARTREATYAGTISGNMMTLTLKVDDADDTETFTLEKGKPGKLVKCK